MCKVSLAVSLRGLFNFAHVLWYQRWVRRQSRERHGAALDCPRTSAYFRAELHHVRATEKVALAHHFNGFVPCARFHLGNVEIKGEDLYARFGRRGFELVEDRLESFEAQVTLASERGRSVDEKEPGALVRAAANFGNGGPDGNHLEVAGAEEGRSLGRGRRAEDEKRGPLWARNSLPNALRQR